MATRYRRCPWYRPDRDRTTRRYRGQSALIVWLLVASAFVMILNEMIMLMAGRVVQASGTAVMVPLLMTSVIRLVPAERRGAAWWSVGSTTGSARGR